MNTKSHYTSENPVTGEPESPMTDSRYLGIPTFFRAPIGNAIDQCDIALIGVPYDGGVSNRPGARHGPREIRNMSSLMRTIHHVSRFNPYEVCRVSDLGDVTFSSVYDNEKVSEEIFNYYSSVARSGALPLTAGGDHSITYPILKGLNKGEPFGLIQIDAHTDTWDQHKGSKFHHGGPFRLATEEGLIDPERTIQIGIRGAQNTAEGWDYSHEKGMRVMFMEEFHEIGVDKTLQEIRRVIGNKPTYLTFDIDSIDPAYAPGTGTPEIGGMTTIDALKLLRGLEGIPLVGADIVEVSPPFDPTGNTALAGATFMYEMLCLMAAQRNINY